ncbi:hypothetical protein ANN_06008 [Periplaneta americana]|uniref:Uncharacterized protein n=1 Tax=Periplaneta americana TaxID=6978 RepID=A0ABQ8TE81_PERAM|nr:hypothetical protein ANN_06008 [Periplaneta americana]
MLHVSFRLAQLNDDDDDDDDDGSSHFISTHFLCDGMVFKNPPPQNIEELKEKNSNEVAEIPVDMLRRVMENIQLRLEEHVQRNGSHLRESQTIEDFGAALHLMRSDLEHLRSVFMAVENGDLGMLKSLGIKDSELGDVKFFLEKLVNTGFLD